MYERIKFTRLIFLFCISVYSIGDIFCLQANEKLASRSTHNLAKIFEPQHKILITLKSLKQVERYLQDQADNFADDDFIDNHEEQTKFINKILVILIGTYQKIITVTVSYYLLADVPASYNLHQKIALILVEDFIQIMKIIGSEFIHVITNADISWKVKTLYCAMVALAIIIVKFGINNIPVEDKKILISNFLKEKKETNEGKSSYLKDKFNG